MQGLELVRYLSVILVGGSTRIPAVVEAVKAETGKEPNKSMNPTLKSWLWVLRSAGGDHW